MQPRRARRVDANLGEVVAVFRQLGCTVHVTNGDWDLTVGYGGLSRLIEVKDGSKVKSARKLTAHEQRFADTWTGGIYLVENIEHVHACVQSLRKHAQIISEHYGREKA